MNRPIHRRSPLISMLIFIVGLTASLLLIALLQLDIGAYKAQLANTLEQTLRRPVKLGDAELSFHGGIALDFRNLRIGDNEDFSLHVPQLSAILDPFGLLRGEIIIEQVVLAYPSLKLGLPLELGDASFDLERLGLKTLQVRNGSLMLFYPDRREKPLRVENFNLVLHSLGHGLVSQVATTATVFQAHRNTELKAFLELARHHQGEPWRQGELRGTVELNDLKRRLFGDWDIEGLPLAFDLDIALDGIPEKNVHLTASLHDSNSSTSLVSLQSDWQSAPLQDDFKNLKLGLAGIPLTGNLHLDRRGPEPQLAGQIDLGRTDIQSLLTAARQHPLRELSGQLAEMSLVFNGPLHPTEENLFAPLNTASLKLEGLSLPGKGLSLTEGGMSLLLQNDILTLTDGQGQLGGTPFTASGRTGRLDSSTPDIELLVAAEADLRQVQTLLASDFWQEQQLSGRVPLQLSFKGPVNQIDASLQADLTQTELVISKLLDKKSGDPLNIKLHGTIKPNLLTLDQALVLLDEQQLAIRGELSLSHSLWAGTLLLDSFDASALQPLSPIFDHFKIAAEVQGRLELSSKTGFAGQFEIKNGAAQLTSLIGHLNQVNGTVTLDAQGIDLGILEARLGESLLNIGGTLKNWHSPLLSLNVTGRDIRAQDLVFTNPEMSIDEIDGQILISAGGILFDRIAVTLAGKTHALVAGQMRSYSNPQTYLEIRADDAEILDILSLFSGPPRPSVPASADFSPTLHIDARLSKGTLDGLAFSEASGTILDRQQIFTLEPLSFKVESGVASGRVEFDRTRNQLLKLSGHIENFDVEKLHQNFFKSNRILRGALSGDFYLEGENTNGQFWKTSQGGGHFEIREGSLKKLHGLAQIFSILNLTQIFTFHLPDINQDGLPFSSLIISPRLEKGVYYFDDLQIVSPAINMSAVGQIDSLAETVDFTVGIKPLRTVDILLEKIPLAGWILTGKEKALITALFTVKGPMADTRVEPVPVSTLSNTVLGIIGRTLTLPAKLIRDADSLLQGAPQPGAGAAAPENNLEK